jgi:hypothetical protein
VKEVVTALTFSLWSIEDSVYVHTFGVSVLFSVASIRDSVSAMPLSLPLYAGFLDCTLQVIVTSSGQYDCLQDFHKGYSYGQCVLLLFGHRAEFETP